MAVVERVVARSRGVEVFITYDDASLDVDGYFAVRSWGYRTAGQADREAQVQIRLRDGSYVLSPRLLIDRTRTTNIGAVTRPLARLLGQAGERVYDEPRLDGLDLSLVTFGP